ncbi:hypothetical protein [Georgenia sp. Z1491]|uniref:hypothetical protein n=1 Tax=Georgenia sp. Z1491 TaxID=3416707 RepID=UPI003CFAA0DC
MTSTSIEQKVRQLDNDVEAIYEMLSTISLTQRRHTNRLGEISNDITAHGARLDSIESKVDAVDGRVGSVESKVGTVDTKVDAVDTKLDRVLELLQP